MEGTDMKDVELEVEALKAIYEDEFNEVSERLFEFRSKEGFVLQIFLTDGYPNDLPVIDVGTTNKADICSDDLIHHLHDAAQSFQGNVMMHVLIEKTKEWISENSSLDHQKSFAGVCKFYQEGRCRFGDECGQLHSQDVVHQNTISDEEKVGQEVIDSNSHLAKTQNSKEKGFNKTDKELSSVNTKKPRMKTASEVINRILWDEQIKSKYVTVGYLDRFVGIIEKRFADFSWEDLASVDQTVLAIPKHRIQYFKYCGETIWDKNLRLDKVFRSTGDLESIIDVIKRVEVSSVSDENITSPDPDDNNQNVSPEETEIGNIRNGPNYFIAVRITDPRVLAAVKEFQDEVVSKHQSLINSMTQLSCLHLTLCTLKLDSDDQVGLAGQTLRQLQPLLWCLIRPSSPLFLKGVGNFHDRILYASVDHHPGLLEFADILKTRLQEVGLNLQGTKEDFIPHVTIMRSRGFSETVKDIAVNFENFSFGAQFIQKMHLCSMTDPKEEDGFHYCVKTIENTLSTISSSLPQKIAQHVNQAYEKGIIMDDAKEDVLSKLTSGDLQLQNYALNNLETLYEVSNHKNGVVIILRGVTGSGKSHLITSSLEYRNNPGSVVVCDPKSLYQKTGICCLDPADRAVGEFNCRIQFLEALAAEIPIVVLEGVFSSCWEYEFYRCFGKLFGYIIRVVEITCPDEETLQAHYKRKTGTSLSWKQALITWKSWEEDDEAIKLSQELLKSSTLSVLKIADAQELSIQLIEKNNASAQDTKTDQQHRSKTEEREDNQTSCTSEMNTSAFSPLPQRAQRKGRQSRLRETQSQDVSKFTTVAKQDRIDPNVDQGEKPLPLPTCHIYNGPSVFKSLFIFDFDMTLFLTPRNGEGQQEYRKLTGKVWPFQGWMARPETIQSPFLVFPGPALKQYRDHYSRSCSYIVILTGRPKSCENAIREVLFANDVFPHRLICKSNYIRGAKKTTVHDYKREALQKLLAEFPAVKLVKLWDDRKDNIEAFEKEAEQHADIKFEIFNVGVPPKVKPAKMQQVNATKRKEAGIKRSPIQRVKTFLHSQGYLRTELKESYAVLVENYMKDLWELTLKLLGVEGVTSCNLIHTFSCTHHMNCLDICLLAPAQLSPEQCITTLRKEFKARDHRLCYIDSKCSYPKLVIGIEFLQFPRINCHVHFGVLAKESLSADSDLDVIYDNLVHSEDDRNRDILRIFQGNARITSVSDVCTNLVLDMVYLVLKSQDLELYGYLTKDVLRKCVEAYYQRNTKSSTINSKVTHTGDSRGRIPCSEAETSVNVDKLFRQFFSWLCSCSSEDILKDLLPSKFVEYMKGRLAVVKTLLDSEKGLTSRFLHRVADRRHAKSEGEVIFRIALNSDNDDDVMWMFREYMTHHLDFSLKKLFEHNVLAFYEYPQTFTQLAVKFHCPNSTLELTQQVMKALLSDIEELLKDENVKIEMIMEEA